MTTTNMNALQTMRHLQSVALAAGLIAGIQMILVPSNTAAEAEAMPPGPGLKVSKAPVLEPRIRSMMETNVVGSIEARVYFVENWEITREQKAQIFFGMFAQADADDQRKLAHAAVSHVANSNHTLAATHLLNPRLPKTVLSVLMTDTLKRDYHIKLPMLLTLAQSEGHPLQKESQELLRGYLGQDHGTNWARWEESMAARLKGNRL